mmetsp:Transcript_66238/g.155919  ORF Transcript_66238/g.155919 Transcript_66238/m.155919 type:complete len:255 (+) Transcript_66238:468-1232(+)
MRVQLPEDLPHLLNLLLLVAQIPDVLCLHKPRLLADLLPQPLLHKPHLLIRVELPRAGIDVLEDPLEMAHGLLWRHHIPPDEPTPSEGVPRRRGAFRQHGGLRQEVYQLVIRDELLTLLTLLELDLLAEIPLQVLMLLGPLLHVLQAPSERTQLQPAHGPPGCRVGRLGVVPRQAHERGVELLVFVSDDQPADLVNKLEEGEEVVGFLLVEEAQGLALLHQGLRHNAELLKELLHLVPFDVALVSPVHALEDGI